MRFVLKRLARLASVLLAVSLLSFLLVNLLPGDPTLAILGPAAGDQQAHDQLTHQLALDQPLPARYGHWLNRALHGDLGESYSTHQPVVDAIAERLPLTVELMLLSTLLALVVAVPVGMYSARYAGGWFDRVSGSVLFALLGFPAFMLGVLLIYLFAVQLGWFDATGQSTWFHLGRGIVATPSSIVLPVVTLAAGQAAVYARLLRSEMLITLRSDYIAFARSKGVGDGRILRRHALRPSSFALITVIGINVGALIGGTIIVESMFALPGMGRLLVTSIYKRDYLVIQGGVVLVSVAFVVINALVDVVYGMLDPRIRHAGAV